MLSHPIKGTHELQYVVCIKATAEISCSGGIGNPLGTDGIQIGFVLSAILEMLKAIATGKQVHGNVDDVVSFIVGQMQLEEWNGAVDFSSQFELLG
jgi:hypothetical protein